MRLSSRSLMVLALCSLLGCGDEEATDDEMLFEEGLSVGEAEAVTCATNSPVKNAYFGDLHVHTSLSADAYKFGTRNDPAAAYAFARGQALTLAGGATAKIDRPLDFMAVTDHSEFLLGNWASIGEYADTANDPCNFTTFRAYEYTQSLGGANQHRNVIFKNSIVPSTMYTSRDYPQPANLWNALDTGCKNGSGCDVVAIPHNSNQSAGQKFIVESHSPAVAKQRADIERLAEIFQGKGNSECLNTVDPSDEGYDPKCDFELLTEGMDPGAAPGYVRAGLGNGLTYYAQHGINPLQMGLIGSTDTHNATGGNVKESTWPGNHGANDSTPTQRLTRGNVVENNPGGLAVAWAEQNTRASIF
ncbi:MAG TPA: DUF3604 domain-containing protein, partial [Myxococcota bacterium]|nr:DUF3604 domain-containing protein [Myxococcota bacterium]